MFQPRSIQTSLSFKDKILSIDYILVTAILILGVVSMFAIILLTVENLNIILKVIF